MADKLQGLWVFDKFTPTNNLFPWDSCKRTWTFDFISDGKLFSGMMMGSWDFSNGTHDPTAEGGNFDTNTIGLMSYIGDEGVLAFTPDETDVTYAGHFAKEAYKTIYIHSTYDEVENADTLYRALSARASHTLVGDDIYISMTSPKGLWLKTAGKLCENDIVITPELEEVAITENGEYTPSKAGYSKVFVNVEAESKPPNIQPLNITENGTYTASGDIDGYSPITVEVAASGSGDDMTKYFEDRCSEVSLPSATKIKDYAFYYDSTLTNISMPNVTIIGEYAFRYCSKLALTSLPSGITSIRKYGFANCSSLPLTSLPSGITSLSDYTFSGCAKLALTSLSSGITKIGSSCFSGCSVLALTSLPSGITSIGTSAFANCKGLTTITFEGTPTSIASNAFYNCTNLTTINVPWAEGAVANAPWGATNATINYNYTGG